MKTRITDARALSAVNPAALRAFATFEGWTRVEPWGQFAELYQLETPAEPIRRIVLPMSVAVDDYAYLVAKAIQAFAETKERSEVSIYRDLVHSGRDVIRFRAPQADDDGSLPIEAGVGLVNSAREALAAAACSTQEPRRSFHVGKFQQVTDYLQRVNLGQTEAGSFVVTLLAPVPPQLLSTQAALWPDLEEEPFERQVTRVFARSLTAMSEALSKVHRGEGVAAFEESVAFGVSANLCEAVAAITQRCGSEISVTWARTRPAPEPSARVYFQRDDADVLVEVARVFRLREPRVGCTLLGYIPKLQRGRRQTHGTVKLTTFVDNKTVSVGVELLPQDYEKAIDAHRRKLGVTVTGDLVRDGQRWKLIQAHDLTIVPGEAADGP